MKMTTISIAWPVWFRIVPPIGDEVGIADRHRQRRVLGQVQILAGQRRNDDAQRLRHDDQPQRRARPQARARRPPRVWPLLTPRMPARTISAMKEAV